MDHGGEGDRGGPDHVSKPENAERPAGTVNIYYCCCCCSSSSSCCCCYCRYCCYYHSYYSYYSCYSYYLMFARTHSLNHARDEGKLAVQDSHNKGNE